MIIYKEEGMRVKKILLFIYFLFTLTLVNANTTLKPLNLSVPNHAIGEAMLVYEDTDATMTLSDIRKLPPIAYKPLNKPIGSHNFSDSAFWYQFKVQNSENSAVSKLIVFEPAWLDTVNITVISPSGEERSYEGGNTLSYDNRALNHYLINFKHSFEVGISTVYVQVKTRDPFIVSISVMEESAFLGEQLGYTLFIGLVYGGIIAMLFYNLFLFLGIKERYYAYYVVYLFTFLMMTASYNGYTFMYLFSNHPEVQNWAQSSSIYLFVLAGLLFARMFLNLEKYHHTLFRITTYLIYFILLTSIVSGVFGGYKYHVILSIVFVMVMSSYVFSIAFHSWLKGNYSARFFLLGAASGLIGFFITSLTVMSFIPYSYLTYKAGDFGMFLDVILISMALADRMKITQEKKLIAEREANTDSLTGLLNRRSYYEISAIEYQRIARHDRNFSVIMLDIDDFKTINDTYGHHIGDEVLKSVSASIKEAIREYDNAFRMGGDEFVLFLPETDEKQAYTLAERIRTSIENINIKAKRNKVQISSSFGISQFRQKDINLEEVLARADEAQYKAKGSGKNRVEVFTKA